MKTKGLKTTDLISLIVIALFILIIGLGVYTDLHVAEQKENAVDFDIDNIVTGNYYKVYDYCIEDYYLSKELNGNQVLIKYDYYVPVSIDVNGERYYALAKLYNGAYQNLKEGRYNKVKAEDVVGVFKKDKFKRVFEEWCQIKGIDEKYRLYYCFE